MRGPVPVAVAVGQRVHVAVLDDGLLALEQAQEQDEDFYMIDFFPIIYLNLGLRAELVENFFILGELAVYDGFIARGGLAFRF